MIISKALQRFIASGGKIKKLKPQKTPKSSFAKTEIEAQERGIKTFKKKFGEKPQYMGFGEASAIKLAGEELAGKTSRKTFFKTFMGTRKRIGTSTSALGRSRTRTAIGIKSTKKVSKKGIIKAKQKGALKAFETARKKEDIVFERTLTKFTGQSKKPHFKTFWKKLDKPIKW
jgi:hypothetical protein